MATMWKAGIAAAMAPIMRRQPGRGSWRTPASSFSMSTIGLRACRAPSSRGLRRCGAERGEGRVASAPPRLLRRFGRCSASFGCRGFGGRAIEFLLLLLFLLAFLFQFLLAFLKLEVGLGQVGVLASVGCGPIVRRALLPQNDAKNQ